MARVDLKIRKDATDMLLNGSTLKEVGNWLETVHGIKVVKSNLNYWKTHPVKERAPKAKKALVVHRSKTQFTDTCNFSNNTGSNAPLSGVKDGFRCAIAPNVMCCGDAGAKKSCPLWSGAGRFI